MHWKTPLWVVFGWCVAALLFGVLLGVAVPATLTWSYTQDPAAPAVAVEVERSLPGQSFQKIAEVPPEQLSFIDEPTPKGAVCYRVRARAVAAWSAYSNTACLPGAPTSLTATP